MYRVVLRSLAALLPLVPFVMASPAVADYNVWVDGQDMRSPFMRIYGHSAPPIGHVKFCRIYPKDCRPKKEKLNRPSLSHKRWRELVAVNAMVNRNVEPTADQELYGELERWAYPGKRGDCEDYVLAKRRMLMQRGWPTSSLLITVVTDEKGIGHAILTVRTKAGDYILDNKRKRVLSWNKVPYRFYKRQSYRNPRNWVSLKPRAPRLRMTSFTD